MQVIPSTADLIMVHNAHRRRSKPQIVRLRYLSLGESVMSFVFDCQQTIEIAAQCCWRTRHDSNVCPPSEGKRLRHQSRNTALQALVGGETDSLAVAQMVGFGLGKSKMHYLSMGID